MQIMQCFHTNIDRAKLVDSQSVFIFSLGGLDSSQFLLIEIDKISDVEHQLFSSPVDILEIDPESGCISLKLTLTDAMSIQ